jgi:hypothetical protein
MNLRTRSIYPYAGNYYPVDIFGYTSHGIPGLEIIGLGKYGKSVKEKFIYLTRVKNLKVPKKRFVICVEGEFEGKKFKDEEYRYLELPMLLMLWSLSGNLALKSLEDCFSSGKVNIDGKFESLKLAEGLQSELREILDYPETLDLKIITDDHLKSCEDYYQISLQSLIDTLVEKENGK